MHVVLRNRPDIANLWSANMDADVRPEPERFLPERFIGKDGNIDMKKREDVISFSVGRKI